MNGLNNFDTTNREYSLAFIDDLIRFWKFKVTGQGHIRPSSSNLVNSISHELLEQSR